MKIDREINDIKISQSVQSQNRINRINHEIKLPEYNMEEYKEINGPKSNMDPNTSNINLETQYNRSDKRKYKINEFEMWKYSYSMVKNGYSILAPEPSQRSRSYRDLILQEMNWMAVDYYQERRWKSHIAKEISNSINTTIIDRKRLKRDWSAKQCSYNVEIFWSKVKGNGEIEGITMILQEYCKRIASGKELKFNTPDIVEEVPTKRNDLLAITVPVYKNYNNNAVNVAKNEVVNATLNHMLVLGAELYPQVHRPPDDEIDVFTLPSLNPKHQLEYNTLMLLLHSLKSNMYTTVSKIDPQTFMSNIAAYRNYTTQQQVNQVLPIRRIPRDEIDPFSLSVNYKDFTETNQNQQGYGPKLILKWEEPTLSEGDFELLDSWMLQSKCWPLISIAMNMRSSSGGLIRRDFSPKTCKDAYYKMKKKPRGLINSSKKLLGPKQTKTILSFIEAPPKPFRFNLIVPPMNRGIYTNKELNIVKTDPKEPPMKTMFGDVIRFYKEESKIYTYSTGSTPKKEGIFSRFKTTNENKSDRKVLLKEIQTQKPEAFLVPKNIKVEILTTNPRINLSTDIEQFLKFDGNMEQYLKSLEVNYKKGNENKENSKNQHTRTRFVKFHDKGFGANHRYSSLNSVVTLATSVNSHDNVVRNVGYSELATRMNKQLRIGFLGIPTKMFVYSLFYCGRIKPDFRVRRVALSISTLTKFVPPPHFLYGKMFDPDVNMILTKSRPNYDKQRAKSVEMQESYTSDLMQIYTAEVSAVTNTKTEEIKIPNLLATFTQVALSKGQTCNQSCFSSFKIPISPSQSPSFSTSSNYSSTPTERKRAQISSLENTPRHKSRQIIDLSTPSENLSSYRTRQEAMVRRQMGPSHNMQAFHPYSQMPMMYGMNQQINSMNNMNQQMMIPHQVNTMNGMNPHMNGKIVYNMTNSQMQHFQEDESYQYRYDQRPNKPT